MTLLFIFIIVWSQEKLFTTKVSNVLIWYIFLPFTLKAFMTIYQEFNLDMSSSGRSGLSTRADPFVWRVSLQVWNVFKWGLTSLENPPKVTKPWPLISLIHFFILYSLLVKEWRLLKKYTGKNKVMLSSLKNTTQGFILL